MIVKPHTIQARLMHWGQWSQQPRQHFDRSSSVFGRIAEMQGNAGIGADGIRYDMITIGGETVMCRPDGGMAEMADRAGRAMAHDFRCREIQDAIGHLPEVMRNTIKATYRVPYREKPRSSRMVAEMLGVSPATVVESLRRAHEKIAGHVYGPFEVVAGPDEVQSEAADSPAFAQTGADGGLEAGDAHLSALLDAVEKLLAA
jgi:hypothetical protein